MVRLATRNRLAPKKMFCSVCKAETDHTEEPPKYMTDINISAMLRGDTERHHCNTCYEKVANKPACDRCVNGSEWHR